MNQVAIVNKKMANVLQVFELDVDAAIQQGNGPGRETSVTVWRAAHSCHVDRRRHGHKSKGTRQRA